MRPLDGCAVLEQRDREDGEERDHLDGPQREQPYEKQSEQNGSSGIKSPRTNPCRPVRGQGFPALPRPRWSGQPLSPLAAEGHGTRSAWYRQPNIQTTAPAGHTPSDGQCGVHVVVRPDGP